MTLFSRTFSRMSSRTFSHTSSRTAPRPWLSRLAAVAAIASGLALLVPPAPAAAADEVSVAEARVERLQALVAKTTEQLIAGTRQWEADQAALRLVQVKLRSTQQRVRAAEKELADGAKQLDTLARQLYMSPSPGRLELAVTRGPSEFASSVQALGALNRSADSRSGIMNQARIARLRLQTEQAKVTALEGDAKTLADRSARRLRELNAVAQRTSDQLSAAQAALGNARAARAAQLERAARLRQQAALRASRGGALCTGKPIGNQQNGNLDPASLCPLWMGNGATLKASAANAYNRMSRYHAATVGGPLCVSGGYRSYQRQVELYRSKPGMAAVPGTSEHGWGNAVDLCGGVEKFGSAAYNWMKANAGKFGFFHPDWAEPSGGRPEAWHWEFSG